jgi:hypothetical protein
MWNEAIGTLFRYFSGMGNSTANLTAKEILLLTMPNFVCNFVTRKNKLA